MSGNIIVGLSPLNNIPNAERIIFTLVLLINSVLWLMIVVFYTLHIKLCNVKALLATNNVKMELDISWRCVHMQHQRGEAAAQRCLKTTSTFFFPVSISWVYFGLLRSYSFQSGMTEARFKQSGWWLMLAFSPSCMCFLLTLFRTINHIQYKHKRSAGVDIRAHAYLLPHIHSKLQPAYMEEVRLSRLSHLPQTGRGLQAG